MSTMFCAGDSPGPEAGTPSCFPGPLGHVAAWKKHIILLCKSGQVTSFTELRFVQLENEDIYTHFKVVMRKKKDACFPS